MELPNFSTERGIRYSMYGAHCQRRKSPIRKVRINGYRTRIPSFPPSFASTSKPFISNIPLADEIPFTIKETHEGGNGTS